MGIKLRCNKRFYACYIVNFNQFIYLIGNFHLISKVTIFILDCAIIYKQTEQVQIDYIQINSEQIQTSVIQLSTQITSAIDSYSVQLYFVQLQFQLDLQNYLSEYIYKCMYILYILKICIKHTSVISVSTSNRLYRDVWLSHYIKYTQKNCM